MPLPVDAAEGPGRAPERQRDRAAKVRRGDLVWRDAGEQRTAQEAEPEADPDAPGEWRLPAGDERIEEGRPERHGRDEDAGHAGRDELLRPDHDRVGTAEQEHAGDGERAPVPRAP